MKPGSDRGLGPGGHSNTLSRDAPVELALLLLTIRSNLDSEDRPELERLLALPPDWDKVMQLAQRHRVSPLLYEGLRRSAWSRVPAPVQALLKSQYTGNLKRNFRLAHHAARLIEDFAASGIRVIPYKGVFMADAVYGHLSSRLVNDIDLLIGPEDAGRANELLQMRGFAPVEKLDQEQVYRHSGLEIEIDLHWQITPLYFSFDYDFEVLWSRSTAAELGGVAYRSLTSEDLLLMLCIQVAKDSWERRQRLEQLQKVCDIANVIGRAHDLDWSAIRRRASEQGLSRALHFALSLAVELLGVQLPEAVAAEVAQDQAALKLARQASAVAFLSMTEPAPEHNARSDIPLRLRQLLFYLKLRERPRDKWQHVRHVIRTLISAPDSR